ncbi:MAG: DNA cytosine methyltransferase [Anditalea sp.]
MKDKIGIFSFFAGAGFLDLGFETTAGFETVFVNENHAPFMDIYKGAREKLGINLPIFGHHLRDIEKFSHPELLKKLKFDINSAKDTYRLTGFIGGPPCPDFSVGGKNKGQEGENGRLSGTYIKLICETRPDFFLFENVKGLWRTKKHRQFYETLKEQLIQNDYLLTERLINSIEYGAPQDRDRIILIGFHKSFLKTNHYDHNGTSFLWNFDWNVARHYDAKKLFGLSWPGLEPFEAHSNKPIPENLPKELTVEFWFKRNDGVIHPNKDMYFKPNLDKPEPNRNNFVTFLYGIIDNNP